MNEDNQLKSAEEYAPLEIALQEPLPECLEEREKVRQMIALAESYGIIVSQHRRSLLTLVENEKALAIKRLRNGIFFNDEGELEASDDLAEEFRSLNADQKEIMLKAEISSLTSKLEYVTHLEELIKRRCSIGQSILNSFNVEKQSAFNN